MVEHYEKEIERLRVELATREGLRLAQSETENSEIASLKRRLAERDDRLIALEATLAERTMYLAGALVLLGVMVVSAWL